MENVTSWFQITLNSLQAFGNSFMAALPKVIGALTILLIGWLIAKFSAKLTLKLLEKLNFDTKFLNFNKKHELKQEISYSVAPSFVISKFIYWIILLLFFVSASDILGWDAVSVEISKIINYLPKIFIATLIFIIGYYIAAIVQKTIKAGLESMAIDYANLLANTAFYVIMTIITVTAINQLGIDTTLITSNLIIILIALLATLSISFGLASKEFLSNILATHYSRKNFKVGQTIKVDALVGEIEKLDKIQVVLKTDTGKIVLPAKTLIDKPVEIIN